MTDPELTPAQERAVRDSLAAARHDEPVPADVAARLEATLADLRAERTTQPPDDADGAGRPGAPAAPTISLAARRRRIAAAGLVAAAAVVVGGVAIGQVVGGAGSGGDSATGSDSAGEAADEGQAGPSAARRGRDDQAPVQEEGAPLASPSADLTRESFRREVRALVDLGPAARSLREDAGPCRTPGAARGTRVPVTYDGRDAVLVLRLPAAGEQRVDLHLCGEPGVARTVTLRTP